MLATPWPSGTGSQAATSVSTVSTNGCTAAHLIDIHKSLNIFGNEQQMRRFSLTQDETPVVADEVGNGNATTEDAKKNRKKKDKENEKKVAATTTSGEKPLAKKVPNHVSKIQEDLAKHKEGGERKQREEKEKLKKELEERLRKKERIKH
ncbi:hypothetical protein Tco_0039782 [Tanacetum coccineum]